MFGLIKFNADNNSKITVGDLKMYAKKWQIKTPKAGMILAECTAYIKLGGNS